MITGGSANDAIAPALAISDAIVILSLFILRYCRISEFFQKINPKLFFYSVVFGFFGLYLVDLLMSSVEIPNYLEDTFRNMAKSSWGFIGICLIGPVMEEMMLRRVIMKDDRPHQKRLGRHTDFSLAVRHNTYKSHTGGIRSACGNCLGMALL